MPIDTNATFNKEQHILCRKLTAGDFDPLLHYLHLLSDETKRRFGPHAFERKALINFYESDAAITGYVAVDLQQQEIIAYAITRDGILQHDSERLLDYGISGIDKNSCTFAPSVADKWQSRGIGIMLFNFVLSDTRQKGIERIILWGGVQATNEKAVNFYKKMGFKIIGQFEYNGRNYDMLLETV